MENYNPDALQLDELHGFIQVFIDWYKTSGWSRMSLNDIVEKLGYKGSSNYLREDKGDFDHILDYGHLFRAATQKPCHLKGVYTLRESSTSAIPVVYVCDVASENG